MKISFKLMSMLMLCSALTLFACDTEEKDDNNSLLMLLLAGGSNKVTYSADGVKFSMAPVPGGTFPTGTGTQTSPDQDGANPETVSDRTGLPRLK